MIKINLLYSRKAYISYPPKTLVIKSFYLNFFFVFFTFVFYAQNSKPNFDIIGDQDRVVVKFKLINNLVILPLKVNGDELNFILDSGVNSNIIFNLSSNDTLSLFNLRKITLRGLGNDGPVEAYYSTNNNYTLRALIGTDQNMFIINGRQYDLSTKLGINVHGVIGYEIFKNFLVKINYDSQQIEFYKKGTFSKRKLKSYSSFDLNFRDKKPYLNVNVKIGPEDSDIPVNLLIDSGGGDALWLFENGKKNIYIPTLNTDQYLGQGLSGNIYGKRSRLNRLDIGKFKLKLPNVAYPDDLSIANAKKDTIRNGSLGGEVLKRFHVIMDYSSSKIYLKPNRQFKKKFNNNLSGMEVVYDGKEIVENWEVSYDTQGDFSSSQQIISIDQLLNYAFKPNYKVYSISKGSVADLAGLKVGDKILKINNKVCSDLNLEEVNNYFFKPRKKLRITYLRNFEEFETTLKLVDIYPN